jgi:KUP system potassium uptake protein
MKITNRNPREAFLVEIKQHLTRDLEPAGKRIRHGIEPIGWQEVSLKVMGVLSVTVDISDGLLTPAQLVFGVQGIEVGDPTISKGIVISVTNVILVVLFRV